MEMITNWFFFVYCILLSKQTAAITSTLMKLESRWTNSSFPLFLLFSKFGGEVGRYDAFKVKPTQQAAPNPKYLLLCSNFCLHADGLRRKRLPSPSQALARAKKLSACWVCQPFWQEAFPSPQPPPPLLSSSTPPSAEVGVLREHRAYRCWCSTAKSCTHIRLWLWFCSPVAVECSG